MPRIVKASRLTLSGPATITPLELEIIVPVEEEIAASAVEEIDLAEAEETASEIIAKAHAESEAILKETEALVRELLAAGKNQGEEIMNQARLEAEEAIAQALAQKETWRQEAFNQGYQEGYQQGTNQAQVEYEGLLENAKQTLAEAYEEKRRVLASSEGDILELVMVMARKVIGMELAVNEQVITNLVRTVLARVCDPENVTVRLNPCELDKVLSYFDDIKNSAGISHLQVNGDPAISPGGCLVETNSGNVDGRLERRLEEVEEALREVKAHE